MFVLPKTRKQKPAALIKRVNVETLDDESLIIRQAIMHNSVCKQLADLESTKKFSLDMVSNAFKPVYRKVIKYYQQYNEAPKRTVSILFEKEIKQDQNITADVLEGIAIEYEADRTGYPISSKYVIDKIIPRFINESKISNLIEVLEQSLNEKRLKKASEAVSNFGIIESTKEEQIEIFEPAKMEYFENLYNRMKEKGNIAFEFKPSLGDIGQLVGPLMHGWLVSLAGPTKSGKSAILLDIALDAAFRQNKKVFLFSPEMTEHDLILERFVPWLTEIPYSNFSKRRIEYYPEVDCVKNQMGICDRLNEEKEQMRPNNLVLYRKLEKFYTTININDRKINKWKKCTLCRTIHSRDKRTRVYNKYAKHFNPAPFWKKNKIPRAFVDLDEAKQLKIIEENIETYTRKKEDNLKIKIIPKYSVSLDECITILNNVIDKYKWKPDIIIFDYLGILKIEETENKKKHDLIDDMWKKASALAQEKEALVFTADQTTGDARTKRLLDQTTTPGAKSIDNHIDKKLGIVKFKDETMNNLARMNMIYDRHAAYDRNNEILIFQDLTYGMAIRDSVWWLNKDMPPYPFELDEII